MLQERRIMDSQRDFQRILDAAAEAKISFGSSTPQLFIKSLLNTLPTDMDLSSSAESSPEVSIDQDWEVSLRSFNPTLTDFKSTGDSLSLPDSFDEAYKRQDEYLRLRPCVKCADTVRTASVEVEHMQSQLAEANRVVASTKLINETQEAEIARVNKIAAIAEQNYELEVSALKDRCTRLDNTLRAESALRQQYEEKALKFDKVDEEVRRLRVECSEQRATIEKQGSAVTSLTESEHNARMAAEDAVRVRDLLQLDKSFLQQEKANAEGKAEHHVRVSEAATSKVLALELKVSQLTDQLLTMQLNERNGFDLRLEKEMVRLREESTKEIEGLRKTHRDIMDRENRVLREAKATLESNNEHLKQKVDSLTSQLSEQQHGAQHSNSVNLAELSEVRAQLKIKSFELGQLGASFEQKMSALRQAELELSVLKDEVVAHKTALVRVETQTENERARLQGELDAANLRLKSYETLEVEIDSAVLRAAAEDYDPERGEAGNGKGGTYQDDDRFDSFGTAKLLRSVRGIPSNPERRVKQAVYLAQRVLETERMKDALVKKVEELMKALESSDKNLAAAKEDAARCAQPTSYLVNKLRNAELANGALQNKTNKLEEELSKCRNNEQRHKREVSELQERLRNLLQQRGELETVRAMLVKMRGLQRLREKQEDADESSSDDDDDGDEDDDDNNSDFQRAEKAARDAAEQSMMMKQRELDRLIAENRQQQQQQQQRRSPTKEEQQAEMARRLGLTPQMMRQLTSPPRRGSNGSPLMLETGSSGDGNEDDVAVGPHERDFM